MKKIGILIILVTFSVMVSAHRNRYGDEASESSVDTGAIVDDAVTAAKIAAEAVLAEHIADANVTLDKFVDGDTDGDMLAWLSGAWTFFSPNDVGNVLIMGALGVPEWATQAVLQETTIINNIINNLKLKKPGGHDFADGDILTVDTSGSTFTGATLAELSAAQALSARPAGQHHYWTFTQADPTTLLALDAEWPMDPNTSAALTLVSAYVSLDADPGTELDADLYFANAGVGYTGETLINTFNTTAGVGYVTSFTDGTIPFNKKVYIKLVAVDAATTSVSVKLTWTFDQP